MSSPVGERQAIIGAHVAIGIVAAVTIIVLAISHTGDGNTIGGILGLAATIETSLFAANRASTAAAGVDHDRLADITASAVTAVLDHTAEPPTGGTAA